MKNMNLTRLAGLLGVLYFILLTLVFSAQGMQVVAGVAYAIISLAGLVAAWDNFRDRNNPTWKTWVGLVGGLLIFVPGLCLLLGNGVLSLTGGNPSTLVNALLSVAAIGAIYLLPIGIMMCLIAGFNRFYETLRA